MVRVVVGITVLENVPTTVLLPVVSFVSDLPIVIVLEVAWWDAVNTIVSDIDALCVWDAATECVTVWLRPWWSVIVSVSECDGVATNVWVTVAISVTVLDVSSESLTVASRVAVALEERVLDADDEHDVVRRPNVMDVVTLRDAEGTPPVWVGSRVVVR
jgi:hypothetical protein